MHAAMIALALLLAAGTCAADAPAWTAAAHAPAWAAPPPLEALRACDCSVSWALGALRGVPYALRAELHAPYVRTPRQAQHACYRAWDCLGVALHAATVGGVDGALWRVEYFRGAAAGESAVSPPPAVESWVLSRGGACAGGAWAPPAGTDAAWYVSAFTDASLRAGLPAPNITSAPEHWRLYGHMYRFAPRAACALTPAPRFGARGDSCGAPYCPPAHAPPDRAAFGAADAPHGLSDAELSAYAALVDARAVCGGLAGTCTGGGLAGAHAPGGGTCACAPGWDAAGDIACEWPTTQCESAPRVLCGGAGACALNNLTYDAPGWSGDASARAAGAPPALVRLRAPAQLACTCAAPRAGAAPTDWTDAPARCTATLCDSADACDASGRGACAWDSLRTAWTCDCTPGSLFWGAQCQWSGDPVAGCFEAMTSNDALFRTCEQGWCAGAPGNESCACFGAYSGRLCDIAPCACGAGGLCVSTSPTQSTCTCARAADGTALATGESCATTRCAHGALRLDYTSSEAGVLGACACEGAWAGALCDEHPCAHADRCVSPALWGALTAAGLPPVNIELSATCTRADGACACDCTPDVGAGAWVCDAARGGRMELALRRITPPDAPLGACIELCGGACTASAPHGWDAASHWWGRAFCAPPAGFNASAGAPGRFRWIETAGGPAAAVLDACDADVCAPGAWSVARRACACPPGYADMSAGASRCHACAPGFGPPGNCSHLDFCVYPAPRACVAEGTCTCEPTSGIARCAAYYGPWGTSAGACTQNAPCLYLGDFSCVNASCVANAVRGPAGYAPACACWRGWGPPTPAGGAGACSVVDACTYPLGVNTSCGHGACVADARGGEAWWSCACEPGWSGARCATPSPTGAWRYLAESESARCAPGWFGGACDVWAPCSGVECGHGACVPGAEGAEGAEGEVSSCACHGGWGRADNASAACSEFNACAWPAPESCSGHGACSLDGEGRAVCTCAGPWGGARCGDFDACLTTDCGAHGRCYAFARVAACACARGWRGARCDAWEPCFNVSCGAGACTGLDACTCWAEAAHARGVCACTYGLKSAGAGAGAGAGACRTLADVTVVETVVQTVVEHSVLFIALSGLGGLGAAALVCFVRARRALRRHKLLRV